MQSARGFWSLRIGRVYTGGRESGGLAMGVDAVTILVDDEEVMSQAADCELDWLNK